MKTIKIIDLLIKISNCEEVPKKIKFNGYIFEYQGDDYLFKEKSNIDHWLFSDSYSEKYDWLFNFLNVEVEIIEESKNTIDKIEYSVDREGDAYIYAYNRNNFLDNPDVIIDYLESKEKESK